MVNLTDEGKVELLKRLEDYGFEVLNNSKISRHIKCNLRLFIEGR